MTTDFQTLFIASGPLPNPETVRTEQASSRRVKDDPLIASGWENAVYTGSVLVVLGVLVVIGVFSQKFEHVVVMALILTGILIACIMIMSL
jgi:hypothetical protein